jgi:hypothetical protein
MPYKDANQARQYHRKWYQQNKERVRNKQGKRRREIRTWFQDYKKTQSCTRCDEDDFRCLDFHHRNPETKSGVISNMIWTNGWGKGRVLEEIDKCDVLCSNCHRKEHF